MKEQISDGVSCSSILAENMPSRNSGRSSGEAASMAALEGSIPITGENPCSWNHGSSGPLPAPTSTAALRPASPWT
ncbi:hypothetical protein D3C85_1544780 [compost metagenome]